MSKIPTLAAAIVVAFSILSPPAFAGASHKPVSKTRSAPYSCVYTRDNPWNPNAPYYYTARNFGGNCS
jgi:hypothetical protein